MFQNIIKFNIVKSIIYFAKLKLFNVDANFFEFFVEIAQKR